MELGNLFTDVRYRNLLSDIMRYISYQDVQNLFLLNKKSFDCIQRFVYNQENKFFLKQIICKRFFERKKGELYEYDEILPPSSSILHDKIHWKRIFPSIDYGDVILLKKSGKFVQIIPKISSESKFFVRHMIDNQYDKNVFPIDYWESFGFKYPFRLWIHVYTLGDSLLKWKSDHHRFRFIGSDLNFCGTDSINLYITYDENLIYVYVDG